MKPECREVREALLDLPESTRRPRPSLARHLEACPDCRSFWEGWRAVGAALRALDVPEPVDRGRVALALARADALQATQTDGRPLARDLVPALLLGGIILGLQAGAWCLWGLGGLAAVQAVSGLFLPLAVLGAVWREFSPTGGKTR